jgi:hypothetical protein
MVIRGGLGIVIHQLGENLVNVNIDILIVNKNNDILIMSPDFPQVGESQFLNRP